jgi:xanthine dehydrogenase YagS FAD-binding subunit
MQAFEYASPATLEGAIALLGPRWGEADILAGGSDLLSLMKDYIHTPKRVVNIKHIPGLNGISRTAAGLRIGTLVTLDTLALNATVRAEYPSLVTAALGVSSQQIRNLGTVGGDLCQRPHCWYFRQGFGLLAKDAEGRALVPQGENRYHAIFGNSGPACFVSASSLGPALVALGAKFRVAGPSGRRDVPADAFFQTPHAQDERETALKPDEILTEILVPPARSVRNATYEVRQREALDFPLATASVALRMKGDTVASASIVMGHVAPVPWLAEKAAAILAGKVPKPELLEQAAAAAVEGATPLSQNAYKVKLAKVAVQRALREAAKIAA